MCDTFEDIYNSLKYSLETHNIFVPSKIDVMSFIGDGLKVLIERSLKASNSNIDINIIFNEFMGYYKNHCVVDSKLFTGMDNVLNILKNNNIKMAVISNKAYEFVMIILDDLKLSHYFDIFYGGDSFTEKKPSPLPLINTIKTLNVNPENVLMVGDSDNDVLAGKSAGAYTCYCSFGYSKLKLSKPDYTVSKPEEIINIIKDFIQ